MSSSDSPMNEEPDDGHYVVTLIDALEAHDRICQAAGDNPAVRSYDQLAGAIGRPYSGYFPEWQKAAALMDGLAGSQIFFTANKRTAITLVDLLIRKSGYRLYPHEDERITVAVEQLSKAVGARQIDLDALTEWYRLRLRRFVG
jgi:prophage maintenance system killer protein